jgi:hypothetical protein
MFEEHCREKVIERSGELLLQLLSDGRQLSEHLIGNQSGR